MSQTKDTETIKTRLLRSITLPENSCCLWWDSIVQPERPQTAIQRSAGRTWFVSPIINAKTHTRSLHLTHTLLHNGLILPDRVQCCTVELTNSDTLRNDLSIVTICSAGLFVMSTEGREQTNVLLSRCDSGHCTHEDLRTVHCCRQHKFAIHHCCATLNSFIQLTVTCSFNSTQRMHCCVSIATMVTRTRHNVPLHVHCLSCSVIMSRPVLNPTQLPNQ